ncbi:Carboxylic ester hydrolase [Fasciola gigantica]|uniref:Carboxylic ester hydrolase n=1 Tax=Fasciola gigantica TaxID=46835 RepID=A0A504YCK5_FASGI|nr:Carboxylic ester hydrolase [Fasciola gigantica]
MSSWEFHSRHRRSEINVSEQNPVASYLDTRYPWFAKTLRPACMQHDGYLKAFLKVIPPMSEDCLYLNIFYPNRTHEDPTIRYPVVIHIHGGSYVCGSNHLYPGHVLASMGVVFVSISYRLGPFGFLSTGDEASMGNYGLWDQLMAIRWVKENIEWFRGDPSRITLMGESAGAASVGLHTVSPASRGQDLFHQVIMMSGSDLSCWAVTDPNRVRSRYYAIELGRALGCSSVLGDRVAASQAAMRGEQWKPSGAADVPEGQFGNGSAKPRLAIPFTARIDASALLRCLRHKKTAEEIANNSLLTPLDGAPNFVWSPVVDGTSGFLPRVPLEERKQGRFDALPLLAGVTHDEGSQVLLSNLARWEERRFRIKDFTDAVVRRTIGNFLNSEKVFRFQATAEELYTRYTWWPNMANNSARWENMVAVSQKPFPL